MSHWTRRTYKLEANHKWTCKPGYRIFVANWGAVRFDIPEDWVVVPGQSFKFHDGQPPDDDCVLEFSTMQLSPEIDWNDLSAPALLEEVLKGDTLRVVSHSPVVHERRHGFELALAETRFIDDEQQREAISRTCLALGGNTQALITIAFWPEDAARFSPVWDEVIRSLEVGPSRNPNRPRRR